MKQFHEASVVVFYITMTKEIERVQREYANKGIITFGIELGQKWNAKQQKWKKAVVPPKAFQTFTVDNLPKIRPQDNALGLACGKINNIFALDIDNASHFEAILAHVGQTEPLTCKQMSASGGFHLIFLYDERLAEFKGRKSCIRGRPDYEIDTRTNNNFLYIEPTQFYSKDVNWIYKWVENRSLLDLKPLSMPDWLFNMLEKSNGRKKVQEVVNTVLHPRPALFPSVSQTTDEGTSKVPFADRKRLCQTFMSTRAEVIGESLIAQYEAGVAKKEKARLRKTKQNHPG